jgi:hypothetical protein
MIEYLAEVCMMEKFFDGFEVRYVPRLDNHNVDHLAWIAFSKAPTPSDVIIEKLYKPSVTPEKSTSEAVKQDLMVIDESNEEPTYDWMLLVRMFLENHLPSYNNAEVERIARKSKQYHLVNGILFRRGVNGMMMKCISRENDIQLLQDIHSSICGSHLS